MALFPLIKTIRVLDYSHQLHCFETSALVPSVAPMVLKEVGEFGHSSAELGGEFKTLPGKGIICS